MQGVLALAERRVQQRPIAGFVDGLANRPLAFDEVGFVPLAGRQPLAIGQIHQTRAFAADLLEKQILVVTHDHGHAPAELAVEAGHNRRYAGDSDARRLKFRCAYLHEIPVRRHRQWQVRVVSQNRLATPGVATSNSPVVGGGHAGGS